MCSVRGVTTPAAALGLEIGSSDLRVIQLNRSGGAAAVTGYAAVARPTDVQLQAGVRQLIDALGPPPGTVITVAHTEDDGRGERASTLCGGEKRS